MRVWAEHRAAEHSDVTCPLCRSLWEAGPDVKSTHAEGASGRVVATALRAEEQRARVRGIHGGHGARSGGRGGGGGGGGRRVHRGV